MGVHFIKDLTELLNLYLNSAYCYISSKSAVKGFRKYSSYIGGYQGFGELGACNRGRGIWGRAGGSSKTGRGKRSLISTFACFLAAIAKV